MTGFEPAAPWPPARCATKLRHIPQPDRSPGCFKRRARDLNPDDRSSRLGRLAVGLLATRLLSRWSGDREGRTPTRFTATGVRSRRRRHLSAGVSIGAACPSRDLNPDALAGTGPSSRRVYLSTRRANVTGRVPGIPELAGRFLRPDTDYGFPLPAAANCLPRSGGRPPVKAICVRGFLPLRPYCNGPRAHPGT